MLFSSVGASVHEFSSLVCWSWLEMHHSGCDWKALSLSLAPPSSICFLVTMAENLSSAMCISKMTKSLSYYSNISVYECFCLQTTWFANERVQQNSACIFGLSSGDKSNHGHLFHTNTNTALFPKIVN